MGGADRGLIDQTESLGRQTTVLVARLAGNENPSDAASGDSRARCVEALAQAAEVSGGRVLRKQRDAVMALLNTSDAAAAAATRMQAYVARGPSMASDFGVKIAFASGPVRQRRHDVVGDTVNLALQISCKAKRGQILTPQVTAATLNPLVLQAVRPAATQDGELCLSEIQWRDSATQILAAQKEGASNRRRSSLRLDYRGKVLLRRREWECITFGRDAELNVVVPDKLASRRHCTVTRHDGGFALQDHSTNGTFVMIAGEGEIHVHADQCLLGAYGWISLGTSGDENTDVIHYQQLAELGEDL